MQHYTLHNCHRVNYIVASCVFYGHGLYRRKVMEMNAERNSLF
jgi:hypothetical protein